MRDTAPPCDTDLTDTTDWDARPFLQKVTKVVPSIIYIYNQRTQSNEYSNRSLGSALGYSAAEIRAMGADVMARICHPDDLPGIGAHMARIADLDDGDLAEVEYRTRHKNGNTVWLMSRDTVFQRGPDNGVLRHIGVATDVTDLKLAEQRALAEHRMSEAVNDELRAFSYAMSHDMRSPSNTLELLLNEMLHTHASVLPGDARELAEMALTTARTMSRLVADVREYTALIGAQAELQDTALDDVLARVRADLATPIAQSQARIAIDPLPVVRGDPVQLRLMFRNLMENAIKFRRPGTSPRVEVTCKPLPDGHKVAITLRDNGIGIDPRDHDTVFHVFKRLNANADYAGTGLGLPICRRIAATHGDSIVVRSGPDAGAAFTVRLPLA